MRGDNLPWECGEHPALGQRHNDMSQTMHTHRVRQRCQKSPLHEPAVESAVLISRQRHKSTPDVVNDIFNYVTDKAHTEGFGAPPLRGSGLPKDERFGKFGHVGTRSSHPCHDSGSSVNTIVLTCYILPICNNTARLP